MTATHPLCEIQPHPEGPQEIRNLSAGDVVTAIPGEVEVDAQVVSLHANGVLVRVATHDGGTEYFAPFPGGES